MSTYSSKVWSDEHLIEMVAKDDHMAFTELYNRYWKILFAIATNKLKDKFIAEELTQDIFADLWKRRNNLKIKTTLSAYLAVSIKYKVIDYLARSYQQNKYEKYVEKNGNRENNSTETWLSFEELRKNLEKVVQKLPDKCRVVYQLSKEEGYKNKQIASDLKISEKTVEAHLTRAVKILRRKLNFLITLLLF